MLVVRESIRAWRFYDGFRTDIASPVRVPQIGTFTPVLSNDGADLPAALQTIFEIGDREALERTVDDAFPGSRIAIRVEAGRFEVRLHQHGLLRPLSVTELSDGTLRFLLWTAALLTPRSPELMVLNEPETSLNQIVVVSHASSLIQALEQTPHCRSLHLEKSFGETSVADLHLLKNPQWHWPSR
jgi:predicted ATPase